MINIFNFIGHLLWVLMHPVQAVVAMWQGFVQSLFHLAQRVCNGDSCEEDGTRHWLDIHGHRLIDVMYYPTRDQEWAQEQGRSLHDYIKVLGHSFRHPHITCYIDSVFSRSLYAYTSTVTHYQLIDEEIVHKCMYGIVPMWYAARKQAMLLKHGYVVHVHDHPFNVHKKAGNSVS
jgi:hypothetical protein